jgi:hypothetical protein
MPDDPTKPFVPHVTRDDVLRIVQRDYPAADRTGILETLGQYPSSGPPERPHRVHAAILKLGSGDTHSLQGWVDLANSDFRDVVFPAENPGFWDVGLVGVDRMSPEALEALTREDKEQYLVWFEAR